MTFETIHVILFNVIFLVFFVWNCTFPPDATAQLPILRAHGAGGVDA